MITSLLLRNWQLVLVLALSAALAFAGKEWAAEHDRYVTYVAEVKAAQDEFNSKEVLAKATRENFDKEKQNEFDKTIGDVSAAWAAAYKLRDSKPSGIGKTPEPVRIVTNICNDATADARLSDALEVLERRVGEAMDNYQQRVASEVGKYQDGAGKYFESAGKCVAATNEVVKWAEGQRLINR